MSVTDAEMTLPWPLLMHIAFGVLELTPSQFWEMTPAELSATAKGWQMAHSAAKVEKPMGKEELNTLMKTFPDEA